MPALRAHRRQRDQLPGLLRGRLRLLSPALGAVIALLAAAGPLAATPAGRAAAGQSDFGRWETATSSCRWQRGGSTLRHDCLGLRLEQNLRGLLSVRFLADGPGAGITEEQLVFAGSLASASSAMRCSGDGRCSPSWPARLEVATVAAARFDQRGLVLGLPSTHLARGHCQLERTQVSCEATGNAGQIWRAEASLEAPTPAAGSPAR